MHTRNMFKTDKLRELRAAAHLTQAALAQRVGDTTQATISRIESGDVTQRPDRALARRIAAVLAVPLSEIYDDGDDALAPPAEAAPVRTMGDYEQALMASAAPGVHTIDDLAAARAALVEAERLTGAPIDAAKSARLWLDAAMTLRVARRSTAAQAVVAWVARDKAS